MHPATDPIDATITPEEGGSPEAAAENDAPHAELEQIVSERNKLKELNGNLTDLLQRSRAEFENFRRRVEREKAEIGEYGAMELMRSVVGLLDDFDRAVAAESSDKVYTKGVELIYQRFFETLKKQGLEPIDSKGRKFDPNLHQAVDKAPSADVDEDTVLDEFQKGYHYKGRLLRPAMVRVAVKE